MLASECRIDEVVGQKYRSQRALDPDSSLIQPIAARGGVKACHPADGAGVDTTWKAIALVGHTIADPTTDHVLTNAQIPNRSRGRSTLFLD